MTRTKFFCMCVALGLSSFSLPALADIAPDDQCSASEVDQFCDTAIVDGKMGQTGICHQTMCQRATPQGPTSYECYRCEASSDAKIETKDGGGCAVSSAGGGRGALVGVLVSLGLVGLVRRSRRT
ncbi:MAG TPA: hypothetical protein VF103_05530 [Polyangiaceae bacterium]